MEPLYTFTKVSKTLYRQVKFIHCSSSLPLRFTALSPLSKMIVGMCCDGFEHRKITTEYGSGRHSKSDCCIYVFFQNNRTVWPPLLLSVPVNTFSPPLLPHKWVTARCYSFSILSAPLSFVLSDFIHFIDQWPNINIISGSYRLWIYKVLKIPIKPMSSTRVCWK